MPLRKINPFRPNYPVGAKLFVGRNEELEQLANGLFQTASGNPSNFLIIGDRGCGKSSLLKFVKSAVSGEIEDDRFADLDFISVSNILDSRTDIPGVIQQFCSRLDEKLIVIEPVRGYWNKIWNFLPRIKVAGIQILKSAEKTDRVQLISDFAAELAETSARMTNRKSNSKNGILVILDEASEASPEFDIGTFFKLLTQELNARGCNNICFILAGLKTLPKTLAASNKSSNRVFTRIELGKLSDVQSRLVIIRGMESANIKNHGSHRRITMDDDVLVRICELASGSPDLLQKLAASAFDQDNDNRITNDDLVQSPAYNELVK